MGTSEQTAHVRISDIPGYPCPPRVRDIPKTVDSWGYVDVTGPLTAALTDLATLVSDELGYLWINGDKAPAYKLPNEDNYSPGAIVFWTPNGLGLWIHPKSLRALASVSRLDLQSAEQQGKWLPVNEVTDVMPPAAANLVKTVEPPLQPGVLRFLKRHKRM